MSTDNIGTEFIENSGLLEMAEANQIVMLFPQVFTSFTIYYCKVANSNTSCLEAHAGFFRLLIKGILDPYVL